MTTLAELTTSVYRDLADEAKSVFSQLQVEDFIRGGMAELNRVAPSDTSEQIAWVTDGGDPEKIIQFWYPTTISLPYIVQLTRIADGWTTPLPQVEPGQTVSTGWTFREEADGGRIGLPQWMITNLDPSEWALSVKGYGKRALPYSTATTLPISREEEYSIRMYAKSEGFDLLSHDRSLYQQWQGQSNNTDVSPTQMMQMAANAKQHWDKQRGLIRVVRKYES